MLRRTFPALSAAACAAAFLAPSTSASQDEAKRYRDAADRIVAAALADSAATWSRLAYLVDTFGPRFSGTVALERSLDWILSEMEADGLEGVRGEPVMVPHWVRGQESATLLSPRRHDLPMLGLGGSVGTPRGGIQAEVLVVGSFDELERRSDEARGRIVLFDAPFTSYGETVRYRSGGAVAAARAGAVGSLVRSVGPVSLQTPHTGGMAYEEGVARIPHAAITVEDASMLRRMQERGERIEIDLRMEATTLPDAWSRNVVAELVGSERPDEVVVLGGHIDSWDVGQGAMDDGGGSVAAWEAVRLLGELGLRPRRTVRVVLWTNEENGLRGATAYADAHAEETHVLAMESDAGVFAPTGFGFTGSDEAYRIVSEIGTLLEGIGAGAILRGGGGADSGHPLRRDGAGAGLAQQAVYGLTELQRDGIRGSELVANPGCYPTGALLALSPLLRRGLVSGSVVINAASGVTGAGRSPKRELLFAEVAEDYRAYAVGNTHRHVAELRAC
ncbi:MAG: M20/M25/M40 family metallo-hydrolase, partial [Gemmatimonadetes bacterium]|nr:M20/M25/M40 family metallo-hydrolase [Gemmatimonadota bacterium]